MAKRWSMEEENMLLSKVWTLGTKEAFIEHCKVYNRTVTACYKKYNQLIKSSGDDRQENIVVKKESFFKRILRKILRK